MVIMVLLAGLAAPRFVGSMRSERLRTGGRVVISMVQLARSRSVSEGRITRLDFDYNQGRLSVSRFIQDEPANSQSQQATQEPTWDTMTDNLGQARVLPTGVTIRYVGEDLGMTATRRLSELVFRPDGSADAAYIVLEGYDNEIMVVEVDDLRFMPRVLDVYRLEDLGQLQRSMGTLR